MEKETLHVSADNKTELPKEDPNLKRIAGVWSVFGLVKYPKLVKIGTWLSGIFFCAALIIFICLGVNLNNWGQTWPIFLLWPVIPSLCTAIGRGKATSFLYPFLAAGIYCLVGVLVPNFWHPGWTILLSIPVYYAIVIPLSGYLKRKKLAKILTPESGIDNQ